MSLCFGGHSSVSSSRSAPPRRSSLRSSHRYSVEQSVPLSVHHDIQYVWQGAGSVSLSILTYGWDRAVSVSLRPAQSILRLTYM
ncbi:hypothetical protein FKM82_030303 [Ascaphus truei]